MLAMASEMPSGHRYEAITMYPGIQSTRTQCQLVPSQLVTMSEPSVLLSVRVSVSVLRLLLLNKFPVVTAVLEYSSCLGPAVDLHTSWYWVRVDWQPLVYCRHDVNA